MFMSCARSEAADRPWRSCNRTGQGGGREIRTSKMKVYFLARPPVLSAPARGRLS